MLDEHSNWRHPYSLSVCVCLCVSGGVDAVDSDTDTFTILQFSDPHINPNYTSTSPADEFGKFGQDPPFSILNSTLTAAKNVIEHPDLVLFSGDSVFHHGGRWPSQHLFFVCFVDLLTFQVCLFVRYAHLVVLVLFLRLLIFCLLEFQLESFRFRVESPFMSQTGVRLWRLGGILFVFQFWKGII